MTEVKDGGAAFPQEVMILVLDPSVVTEKIRQKADDLGMLLIEADDPQKVRMVRSKIMLHGDALSIAALKGLDRARNFEANALFVREILDALLAAREGRDG